MLFFVGISAEKSEDGELAILPDDAVDVGEPSVDGPLAIENEDAYVPDGTEDVVVLISSLDVDREDVMRDSIEAMD